MQLTKRAANDGRVSQLISVLDRHWGHKGGVVSTADLMVKIRQLPNALVEEGESAWTVRLPKPGGIQFEVVVPKDVLEWFVTARNAEGAEIWSD
jgi:hypothetical protein